jgi:dCMP deaminase
MQNSTQISWDKYFFNIAEEVSKKSHCLRIKRGCVIVRDRQILSTGYNGPPAGFWHCDDWYYRNSLLSNIIGPSLPKAAILDKKNLDKCPRDLLGFGSREGKEYCPATHAEMNTILQAARNGVSIKGASLYCNFSDVPCAECSKSIINSGLSEIVLFDEGRATGDEPHGFRGKDLLDYCKIKVRHEK